MLADIASGETGTADVIFLIAFIVAAIGCILYLLERAFAPALVAGAIAALALGWVFL
jgi:hypothetical protein